MKNLDRPSSVSAAALAVVSENSFENYLDSFSMSSTLGMQELRELKKSHNVYVVKKPGLFSPLVCLAYHL